MTPADSRASNGIGSGSRIAAMFARRGGRPVIIPYVTAGFPRMDDTVPIVNALAEAGADAVEIGIPFSDPLADGPTIQRASERALANGMTVARVLETVAALRADDAASQLPLLLMGYCNPVFAYGLDRFLEDALEAGVDGLILPDVPPEEAGDYRDGCQRHGLSTVFLVAPNAPDERIEIVDRASTGFVYCVTITGITGARRSVQQRTFDFLRRVRSLARNPFVVGFGIKDPEHVRLLGPLADGVVVGSALIDAMASARQPAEAAAELVSALCAAAADVAAESQTTEEAE